MKAASAFALSIRALLAAGIVVAWCGVAWADGRPGSVEWSDGRKLAGAISLTPGKDLRIFTDTQQYSLSLGEVKEIRFTTEKEEMREGFYFPNAGQATQAKTGEVYPVRYLHTQIALANGQVLEGHLFTTVFYVGNDDATEKVVLMAKQTGTDGQKLTDLVYPTLIHFDAGGSAAAGSSRVDLTQAGFVPLHPPVIVTQPDLTLLPMEQTAGKPIWTVPSGTPGQLLFAVEAADGIHVAWPSGAPPGPTVDPDIRKTVEAAVKAMQDFFDTRAMLGCFAGGDGTDLYSLVMLKRTGKELDGNGDTIAASQVPWSLVILRWKYDPDQKKVILLNRALLMIGHTVGNSPLPAVLVAPELLKDISGDK